MRLPIALLGVGMIVLAACSTTGGTQPAAATPGATDAAAKGTGKIVAQGSVLPVRNAALSFQVTGVISEVLVTEGSSVTAGQVIVRLDARQQQAAVAQARAGLSQAQAQLDALKAGARPQEVATAQAALDAAQAALAKLQAGARPEDILASAAAVAITQAQLAQVQEGPSQQSLDAAHADVANAQAALQQAQFAYDASYKQNPAAIGASAAALALEQATNNFYAARSHYDDLAKGPTVAALAVAKAQVQQASAQFNAIKAAPRQADLDAANAEVHRAQAQLELVKAGARAEDISAAQAGVDSAQAVLEQAKSALELSEIRAPFAGELAYLDAHVGERAAPGVVLARVGDPSQWEIDTTDLTELNIVSVHEGAKATITVDGLPGVELTGKVARIRQYGENKQGDINYTVVVLPDHQENRLRWNMTASVTLEP
ncbi:MAG TPA: HlyD family efflux transporter periplasmic adaptor subunit, partial [Anaerolineae bacterium]